MALLILNTLAGEESPLTGFYDFKRTLKINGDYMITFSIDRNERNAAQFDQLVNKNKLVLDGDAFIIDDMERDPDGGTVTKEITARHEMFDRLYANWVSEEYTAQKSLQDWMAIVLANTGLDVEITGDFPPEQYENFGNDNSLNMFKDLIDRFQVEYRVYGTRIVIEKHIGIQRDAQFRHGHNLKTFSDEFNTDNLVTRVTAKGKNDDNGNPVVQVTVDSPNQDKFERIYAIAVQDERFTQEDSLTEFAESQFNEGDYSAKVEFIELVKNGLKLHEYDVGDNVWCIYDKQGMGLDLSVRIVGQDDNPFDKSVSPVVTLGTEQNNVITSFQTKTNEIQEIAKQANQNAILAIVQANGKNRNFYTDEEPTEGMIAGDIWFEKINGQYLRKYHYDGTQWILDVSADANDAMNKAADALESANGKNTVYHQSAQPIAGNNGDVWFQQNADGTISLNIYQDGTWSDPTIDGVKAAQDDAATAVSTASAASNAAGSALSNAQTAINTANNAAGTASTAATNAQTAISTAQSAVSAANAAHQTASDAVNQASTAATNAQTAINNAQSALSAANAANANANTREQSIIKSATAPASPVTDQLWVDTSAMPQLIKRWSGTAWITLSPTQASQIGAVSTTTYTTDITNINNTISQKADKTTVNTLTETVSDQATLIQQNSAAIDLKANQTDVDTLSGTVSSQGTAISQNASAIALKADQSTVNTLTGRVSTAESNITANATAIAARITTTDADAKYATQTSLTATSSSLTSSISKVQTNLSNVQVGGQNLLLKTYLPSDWLTNAFCCWSSDGKVWSTLAVNNDAATASGKSVSFSVNANQAGGIYYPYSNLVQPITGQPVVLQCLAKGSGVLNIAQENVAGQNFALTSTYQKLVITFTAGSTYVLHFYGNGGSSVTIADMKLEFGNKATSWSAAFADGTTTSQFSQLNQTVNGLSTQVSNKVDSSTYNSYTAQTANTIATLLTKTDAAGTYATQSALSQTSSSLSSQITSAQTNAVSSAKTYTDSQITQTSTSLQSTITASIAVVQIGGENVLANTNFMQGVGSANHWDTWASGSTFTYAIMTEPTSKSGNAILYTKTAGTGNTSGGAIYRLNDVSKLITGQIYTISCYVKASANCVVNFSYEGITGADKTFNLTANTAQKIAIFVNGWSTTNNVIHWYQSGTAWTVGTDLEIYELKMEIGNKATDWSAAYADMATQSQFTQVSSDINLRVSKNDVVNQINLSTESILIAGNKVHITGQTTIDNASIQSAAIAQLDAGKITTGTLDTNRIAAGSITAQQLNVANLAAISANLGNVTAGDITGVNIHGVVLTAQGKDKYTGGISTVRIGGATSGAITNTVVNINGSDGNLDLGQKGMILDYDTYNGGYHDHQYHGEYKLTQMQVASIGFNSSGSETSYKAVTINADDGSGVGINAVGGIDIKTDGNMQANTLYGQSASIINNIELGGYAFIKSGDGAGSDPAISLAIGDNDTGFMHTSDGYLNWMNNYNWTVVSDPGGSIGVRTNITVGNSLVFNNGAYLTANNGIGVDVEIPNAGWCAGFRKDGGNYSIAVRQDVHADNGDVFALAFVNTSRVELKQDITALDESIGLTLVNALDIYKFKYKKDVEYGRDKFIYGGIIGDGYQLPDDFKDYDEQGINVYSATFIGLKAVQELFTMHQEDATKIADLETRLSKLEAA